MVATRGGRGWGHPCRPADVGIPAQQEEAGPQTQSDVAEVRMVPGPGRGRTGLQAEEGKRRGEERRGEERRGEVLGNAERLQITEQRTLQRKQDTQLKRWEENQDLITTGAKGTAEGHMTAPVP